MLPLLRGCSSTGKMVNPSRDGGLPWTMSQTCARHAHTPLDVSFCYTLASRRIFCYFSFLSSLCYGPWWSDINEWMNDWMMDELIDWLISCDWVDWTARCDAGQKWTDRHTATEADGYLDPNSVVVSGYRKTFPGNLDWFKVRRVSQFANFVWKTTKCLYWRTVSATVTWSVSSVKFVHVSTVN